MHAYTHMHTYICIQSVSTVHVESRKPSLFPSSACVVANSTFQYLLQSQQARSVVWMCSASIPLSNLIKVHSKALQSLGKIRERFGKCGSQGTYL